MYKGTTGYIALYAWDGANSIGRSSYSTGITIKVCLDNSTGITPGSTLLEVGSTQNAGVYLQPVSSSETNCNVLTILGETTNTDIKIRPVVIFPKEKNNYSLSSAGAATVLASIVEGTFDLKETLRILLAKATGKASGGGTTAVTFRDLADGKNRIVMTVDSNGNRTTVALDETT